VQEIAEALQGDSDFAAHSSLDSGAAGIALFFSYLDRVFPNSGYDEQTSDFLERAILGVSQGYSPPSLYGGFPGVAWVLEHLEGRSLEPGEEDPGEDIAEAIGRYLERERRRGDFDLVAGLVGLGVYALERRPRPSGEECLRQVLNHLAREVESLQEGIAWHTPAEHLVPEARRYYPQGSYNLGVAHGTPGVIGFLSEACAVEAVADDARSLLAGAVPWLLGQRSPPDTGSAFPYALAPGMVPNPARLAWCYGDLGIATVLLGAARHTGEPAWEHEALDLARTAAARSFEDSGVVDAGLCHGAAGNAHLFNRLYQASGDPVLEMAAHRWLDRALELRRPGEGLADFLSYLPDERGEMSWRSDPGFLTGAAGIGLALLAAATPVEPCWDRLLLASVPAVLPLID
jgi:lantibiotic modifying enzyme